MGVMDITIDLKVMELLLLVILVMAFRLTFKIATIALLIVVVKRGIVILKDTITGGQKNCTNVNGDVDTNTNTGER